MMMEERAGMLVLVCLFPLISSWQVNSQPIEANITSLLQNASQPEYSIARNIFDFGLNLQNALIEKEVDKNVAISPASIAGVLSMALLGSVGSTYDELAECLGFSSDVSINLRNHKQFGEILKSLNKANVSETNYANAIFVDRDSYLRNIYKQFVQDNYNSSVLNVDFVKSEDARQLINTWVKEHTKERIAEFLQQPLPPSSRVVLASALHFSAQWRLPFQPEYTIKLPFQKNPTKEGGADNETVLVESMLNGGYFNYTRSADCDCELVALPYNDSVNTLYAIKPTHPERKTLTQLLKELNADKIQTLIDASISKTVVMRFPRMNLTSRADLKTGLQALGIHSLFSPTEANFALMIDASKKNTDLHEELLLRAHDSETEGRNLKDALKALPNPGLHVDSILHEVAININEYGTEAVAATGAFISRSAEMFIAKSPFYIFIRNEITKLVTFSAAVFDPTAL